MRDAVLAFGAIVLVAIFGFIQFSGITGNSVKEVQYQSYCWTCNDLANKCFTSTVCRNQDYWLQYATSYCSGQYGTSHYGLRALNPGTAC